MTHYTRTTKLIFIKDFMHLWLPWTSPQYTKYKPTLFHCASLQFTDTMIFLQIATWQPRIDQLSRSHFSNSICSLCVRVSRFSNPFLYCLLWWSVIGDLLRLLLSLCWGHHRPHPHKTVSLASPACVPTAPLTAVSPSSLPLLRPPCALRHSFKLGQFITLPWPPSVQVKKEELHVAL